MILGQQFLGKSLCSPNSQGHNLILGDSVVFHMAFQLRVLLRESGLLWEWQASQLLPLKGTLNQGWQQRQVMLLRGEGGGERQREYKGN